MPKYRRLDTPVATLKKTVEGVAWQHMKHDNHYQHDDKEQEKQDKAAFDKQLETFSHTSRISLIACISSALTIFTFPIGLLFLPIAVVSVFLTIVGAIQCLWILGKLTWKIGTSPFVLIRMIREGMREAKRLDEEKKKQKNQETLETPIDEGEIVSHPATE